MAEFLKFIDNLAKWFPIHVAITYSKTCDWCILVYKRGCADDYPESERLEEDAKLCYVEGHDIELVFARAQCEVKDWMLKHNGGY